MALKGKRIYITFGRFQPCTWGHEDSFNAIKKKASENKCDYRIFISHTNDKKDNPLTQKDKLKWMKLLLPDHAKKIIALNPSQPQTCIRYCMSNENDLPYASDECVYMVGSDRVNAMQYLKNYNAANPNHISVDFSMKYFEIESTGKRDADGKTFSISGTKMRGWAKAGDIDKFKAGLPKENKLTDKQIEEFMLLL
jgi:nicotinic acid mononucleotide adenylyltransferase